MTATLFDAGPAPLPALEAAATTPPPAPPTTPAAPARRPAAFTVDRDHAIAAARRTGRATFMHHGQRIVVTANIIRYAWLKCARGCTWRRKVPLGALDTVLGEHSLCPACAMRATPAARRAVARGEALVTVERLVTR